MTIFNLFGQNKPKNDPYWEFDKSEHFRPQLNKGAFFKLRGFDFGWFIKEPISKYIEDEKGEPKKVKSLSYAQKALYYWWNLSEQVDNGGFDQYYFNESGKYIATIIKALKHIGDHKMAKLVTRSYEIYLKENEAYETYTKENDDFKKRLELYNTIEDYDDLDSEFYNLSNQTMEKIENYIRMNPNEICLDEEGNEFDLNFSGEVKTYYPNNTVKEVISLDKSLVVRNFKSYFENGKLCEEIYFLKGKQTGERIEYYENGNKKFSIEKSQNPKGNLHSHYYENGNLKSTEIYVSKYDRDGKWIQYYSNGQIKSETEFINKEFFVQNCWREDGTQILKDGTGLYINEYSIDDGIVERTEQEYKNNKQHGKQYFYSNDKLTLYQEMSKGKKHGITKTYDDEGNLKEEIIYNDGVEKSRKKHN